MSESKPPQESSPYFERRDFPVKPWLLKVGFMCLTFATLSYYRYQLEKKNDQPKRPQLVIPASRPSK